MDGEEPRVMEQEHTRWLVVLVVALSYLPWLLLGLWSGRAR